MRTAKTYTFRVPMGTMTIEGTVYTVTIIQGMRYYQLANAKRCVSLVPALELESRLYHREPKEITTP